MESKFIILKKFYNQALARMYKAQLEDAGIPSFINFDTTATMLPISGDEVSLTINEEDLEAALAIVTQLDLEISTPIEEEYHHVDHGDIEYLRSVNELEKIKEPSKVFIWFVAILLIIIIFLAISSGFNYF